MEDSVPAGGHSSGHCLQAVWCWPHRFPSLRPIFNRSTRPRGTSCNLPALPAGVFRKSSEKAASAADRCPERGPLSLSCSRPSGGTPQEPFQGRRRRLEDGAGNGGGRPGGL